FFRPPNLVYPFGAHVAVVEADRETGRITVRDFISVDDCGVRISPILVAGQVHGGLAQGIAQALLEALVYSPDRQLVTGSLLDEAGRTGDAGAAETAVAAWILGEILLVIVLGVVELWRVENLGRDRAVARLREQALIGIA